MIATTLLSKNSGSHAYLAMFGISLFVALVVWILILATHMAFRYKRRRGGLPPSPVRLWGAPVTTAVTVVFLATVLVSLNFIDGMQQAWQFGLPFLAIVVIAYHVVRRSERSHAARTPTGSNTKPYNGRAG